MSCCKNSDSAFVQSLTHVVAFTRRVEWINNVQTQIPASFHKKMVYRGFYWSYRSQYVLLGSVFVLTALRLFTLRCHLSQRLGQDLLLPTVIHERGQIFSFLSFLESFRTLIYSSVWLTFIIKQSQRSWSCGHWECSILSWPFEPGWTEHLICSTVDFSHSVWLPEIIFLPLPLFHGTVHVAPLYFTVHGWIGMCRQCYCFSLNSWVMKRSQDYFWKTSLNTSLGPQHFFPSLCGFTLVDVKINLVYHLDTLPVDRNEGRVQQWTFLFLCLSTIGLIILPAKRR